MDIKRILSAVTVFSCLLSSLYITVSGAQTCEYGENDIESRALTENVQSTDAGTSALSGGCGMSTDDTVSWSLCDGTLVISGEGRMANYTLSSQSPWYAVSSDIVNIVIEDGITYIGSYAFYGCDKIVSAAVGCGVEGMGFRAFYGCESLARVHIKSVSKWCAVSFEKESNPFCNNAHLYIDGELVTELFIPEGVTSVSNYAFYGCLSLSSVTVPTSLMNIGTDAFKYCTSMTDVYYVGSEEQWEKISAGQGNAPITSSYVSYNCVAMVRVEIATLPEKLEYLYGEELLLDGIKVNAVYSDGTAKEITDYTVSGYDKYSYGTQNIIVSYEEYSCSFTVTVNEEKPTFVPVTVSFLTNVTPGTTVSDVHKYFEPNGISVSFLDEHLTLDDIVSTGTRVRIYEGTEQIGEYIIIIKGDVNCDGEINGQDLVHLTGYINGVWVITYPQYADIDGNGVVNQLDKEALSEMIMKLK